MKENVMSSFPRTNIGGISVSRMVIGTNWFLGFSHTSASKDAFIREHIMERRKLADIISVFLEAGVDTIMGPMDLPPLVDAIKEAEDRIGHATIRISTPGFPLENMTPEKGFDLDAVARILDQHVALGARICMPHAFTTDAMVDRWTRKIRAIDQLTQAMRARNLVPGLSTHLPETIIYADDTNADVETYIALYNAVGYLMHVEVDWMCHIIRHAKKPVITIKPFAAGQIRPFQALPFVWGTLRKQDLVTVGTMSPKEASEVIELSMNFLEQRDADAALQETRSKDSVKPRT
jgi:hypothetical protein